MKKEKTNRIDEWGGGAGFGMMGGVRGGVNRGGFSGGSGGALQTMYVYEIKPLNHYLEPPPDNAEIIEIITIGKEVRGNELNKKDGDYHQGVLRKIEKSPEGLVKYYVILDPKTSTFMKLDPTTVTLVDKTQYNDPLDLSMKRDLNTKLKDQMKVDKVKMRENKVVSEDLEDYLPD